MNSISAMPLYRMAPAWLGSLSVHALLLLLIGISASAAPRSAFRTNGLNPAATAHDFRAAIDSTDEIESFEENTLSALDAEQVPAASVSPAAAADSSAAAFESDPFSAGLSAALANPEKFSKAADAITGERRIASGSPTASATPAASSGARGSRLHFSKGRTSFYGIEAEGSKFIYVFDRSGSMEGAPIRRAKEELIASLQPLGDVNQFQIVFYNHDVQIFSLAGDPRRLVFGNEANKARAERFIHAVTADGGTSHETALRAALAMRPDVIYFLTDADQPAMTHTQLDALHRVNAGAVIHAVEFGVEDRSVHDNFIVHLARRNGGTYKYINIRAFDQ